MPAAPAFEDIVESNFTPGRLGQTTTEWRDFE